MTPLSILYLGPERGTCLQRANALRRLGHVVEHIDVRALLPDNVWIDRVIWKLGGDRLTRWVMRYLPAVLAGRRYDLCYIDGGELITPPVVRMLREHASAIVNYCIDDPLGSRDGARSRAYRQSLPHYDLCVVMRAENIAEATARGARNVLRVHMCADEVAHAPRVLTEDDHRQFDCDVLFLGTWFPERGPLLLKLIELGVPVTIRGPNWHKAPEWLQLQAFWKGGELQPEQYAKAIQCARVNLGLLSKGNRDLHTTRSMEVPALGALLCAERTSEHGAMYSEGHEALFWGNAQECAAACKYALHSVERRNAIAAAGRVRLQHNGHYNEPVMQSVLQHLALGDRRSSGSHAS